MVSEGTDWTEQRLRARQELKTRVDNLRILKFLLPVFFFFCKQLPSLSFACNWKGTRRKLPWSETQSRAVCYWGCSCTRFVVFFLCPKTSGVVKYLFDLVYNFRCSWRRTENTRHCEREVRSICNICCFEHSLYPCCHCIRKMKWKLMQLITAAWLIVKYSTCICSSCFLWNISWFLLGM